MAYEFLKKLFGQNEDGTAKSLTYEDLEKAIDEGGVKVVDLSTGAYVSKEKFDRKETEYKETKALLDTANETIKGYTEMDIDGIKKSVSDWETKYNTDVQALNDKLAKQQTEFDTREYLGQFNYTSDLARKAVFAEFMAQGFKRGDDGKFLGADDYMNQLKEKNPGAFVTEQPPTPAEPKPKFQPTAGPIPQPGKKLSLSEMMRMKANNPSLDVNSFFDK